MVDDTQNNTNRTALPQVEVRPMSSEDAARAIAAMEKQNAEALGGSGEAPSPALRAQIVRLDEDGTVHIAGLLGAEAETIRAMDEAAKGTGYRYAPGFEVVRAVNSHEALVGALEQARAGFRDVAVRFKAPEYHDLADAMDAAIRLASPTQGGN